MSNILTYPGNDANGAPIVFADLINDISKTKLLVLFNDAVALQARDYVNRMVQAHPQDYVSIIFIFAEQPLLLLPELRNLPVNILVPAHNTLNWDLYNSYRIISISPANKLISDVITTAQLNGAYGLVRAAIFAAFDNG